MNVAGGRESLVVRAPARFDLPPLHLQRGKPEVGRLFAEQLR